MREFTSRTHELSPEELERLISYHRTVTKKVASRFGGIIFKELGDSFLIAFSSSTHAVQMAISLQRVLSEEQVGKGESQRIDIRASVTTGDVLVQNGDYFGDAVNLAARIEAITPPGEVYVAESTQQTLRQTEVLLDFVDEHRFKGIPFPVPVYRAVYRHATRFIRHTTIVVTDILHFTSVIAQLEPAEVERLIDFWDEKHRELCHSHGGTVQLVFGDQYLLTFEDCNDALEALFKLPAIASELSHSYPNLPLISFVAGIEVGDLCIYRTAVFGPAANRATFAAEIARIFEGDLFNKYGIFLTDKAVSQLPPKFRKRCVPFHPNKSNLVRRMKQREIDQLWVMSE